MKKAIIFLRKFCSLSSDFAASNSNSVLERFSVEKLELYLILNSLKYVCR